MPVPKATRLAASAIAVLFHKPLIDVAAGVHGRGVDRQLGVSIRLTLPGTCLLCLGGLRDESGARPVLRSAEAESAAYAHRLWAAERAGSLRSLSTLATGTAIRTFEDLVAERIGESLWLQMEFDTSGRASVTYPVVPVPRADCPLCRLAGLGDEGLAQIGAVLATPTDFVNR